MRRSKLGPGEKSRERGSTFASRGEGLKRTDKPSPRRPVSEASTAQRRKVYLQVCAARAAGGCWPRECDPAHLTPRSFRGCDSPDCVIALCRHHHRLFDDGELDLLPFISGQGFETELAHMQLHYSDPLSVIHRLSGFRWVPERQERAA